MARRSPANARYRKDANVGSTRRSASAAKPKRSAGSSSGATSKPKKDARPRARSPLAPQSAEEKKWRRVWWWLMGAALACVGLAFFPPIKDIPGVQTALLSVEMGSIAAALYIDFSKIRPARKAAAAAAKEPAKPGKSAPRSDSDAGAGDAGAPKGDASS